MSGDEDNLPPAEPDRTVFSPSTGISPAPVPAPAPSAPSVDPVSEPPVSVPVGGTMTSFKPTGEPRRIQVGDVLNHIFEVRRFIARGGMGEVFEGVNVNSDERVAIKGILPHLAADPAVQEMFRKEARTLTRLSHPALVQYRVLAQEPQIGAFYIAAEYIDGPNLSDQLREIKATPAELAMLTKRLAEGLAAAHQLGAIHRDISPDNVMLENGRLDRAKIIDFGIAKDLTPGSATIVGDGFAGKLNYVAPEQLGDFNREVGAWTDVYSLGLTILAVAQNKDVDLGGSFVDAVDKRRKGPDLSAIPAELRPIFARMLEPDPAKRVRSMEDVVELLAGRTIAPPVATKPVRQPKTPKALKEPKAAKPTKPPVATGAWQKPAIIGGGVAAALVAAMGVWHLAAGSGAHAPAAANVAPTAGPGTGGAPVNPVATARAAIAAGLGSVQCSWLDLGNVEASGSSAQLAFTGVAGRPADAQAAISRLLVAKGLQAASIDFSNVSLLDPRDCGAMDAFSQIRAPGVPHIRALQPRYVMAKLQGDSAGADAGKMGTQVVVDFDVKDLPDDFSIVGLEPDGAMSQLSTSRNSAEFKDPRAFHVQPSGTVRLTINVTHSGTSGFLLLTGKGPFDAALLNTHDMPPGPDWPARFLAKARQQGWHAEWVWVQSVAGTG
ncbi:serine/threonine-protein kinase [Novosphingobium sp.]|uniref:serine/threonine-protein kinase n=1 Tax=Novosphingobium sp. TaxID=1874826 RepID=UPI003B51E64E